MGPLPRVLLAAANTGAYAVGFGPCIVRGIAVATHGAAARIAVDAFGPVLPSQFWSKISALLWP